MATSLVDQISSSGLRNDCLNALIFLVKNKHRRYLFQIELIEAPEIFIVPWQLTKPHFSLQQKTKMTLTD
ncbi:UNVERIFIED_CONTAM: hypothetical protein NCL1_07242 [Trichonephila clavipes]